MIITVDGPSGSGKGTVCQLLASKLGLNLLDSGALYRLTAVAVERAQVSAGDEVAVAALARELDVVFQVTSQGQRVLLAGDDVSQEIRREDVGMRASRVAAMPLVREALLLRQRGFAQASGLVADGRDMGTVVFPEADVKVFLTASSEERAKRRFLQLQGKGEAPDMAVILADIEDRDRRDKNRSVSPLIAAQGALEIDSSSMAIDEVVLKIMQRVAAVEVASQ